MIDLITGHQGMPHISAKQISDLNNAMMEGYGADKIMRMKDGTITLTNNDVFTVNPGYWRVNGYDMEIQQTETIQIVRPTGNLKRYDDIYIEILRDIPSGAERAELVKVEGSPATSSPSHPPVPTEPELNTDVLLLCIKVGYVYATSTYTSKQDDTIPYHYVSETEYIELLTHLQQEQYSRAHMSSGNFAPIRVEDIIKLNTKGTWTHTDPSNPGGYANDTYTLDSGNIVFQISSNGLGLHNILVTTSSTYGYTEKLILFKGEVAISSDNLWLPRNGSQVRSGFSAAAIVNGEEYSVGTGGFYVELPEGVLTELYIQATSGISENISFYPTIRYEDDPTYTRSYPPAPTNIMLWNEISDEVSTRAKLGAHNLLPLTLDVIKRSNTLGTWNKNVYTYNGITFTVNTNINGRVTGIDISGTYSTTVYFNLIADEYHEILEEGEYILTGLNTTSKLRLYIKTDYDNVFHFDAGQGSRFKVSQKTTYPCAILISGSFTPTSIYPMVRLSTDPCNKFEPYIPGNRLLATYKDNGLLGAKNFLQNIATTKVTNGVTFTVNADGSVTASTGSGGATADADLYLNPTTMTWVAPDNMQYGQYIISGCPSGGNQNTKYFLAASIQNGTSAIDEGDGASFSYLSGMTILFLIRIKSGMVLTTPITFYPMVRLASDTDPTFRPYAKTNKELTDDSGLLKSKLIAPIQLTDLNSLPTDMGANNFSINFYNSSALSRPSDHSGIVFTFRSSSTYATQFAVANLENKIYVRYKDANNIAAPYWSSWNAIG